MPTQLAYVYFSEGLCTVTIRYYKAQDEGSVEALMPGVGKTPKEAVAVIEDTGDKEFFFMRGACLVVGGDLSEENLLLLSYFKNYHLFLFSSEQNVCYAEEPMAAEAFSQKISKLKKEDKAVLLSEFLEDRTLKPPALTVKEGYIVLLEN